MGANIMRTVSGQLTEKLDTSKVEGLVKELPNLTPPNIITKLLSDKEYWQNALNVQRNIAEKLEAKFQIFFKLFGKEFK